MKKREFDERQLLEQGRGYKIGFFTFFAVTVFFYVSKILFDFEIDPMPALVVHLFAPTLAAVIYFIVKDAYFEAQRRKVGFYVVNGLLDLIWILNMVVNIRYGNKSWAAAYLMLVIGDTVIFLVCLVKWLINKKRLPEE